MSEYDYGNEPVDPRTLVGLNQYMFDRNLRSFGDSQDEDEGNTELNLMNGVSEQAKQEALIRKLLAEYGVQIQNQPLSQGSANQIPTPGIASPDPVPTASPSLPDPHTMYTNIPSFEEPDFTPHLSTGMGRTAGQAFIPGYGSGMDHSQTHLPSPIGVEEITPPPPIQKGIWEQILECLQEAAGAEMAGVVMYSFYSEVLNGVKGKVLAELFKDNATESLGHYSQVTHWMLRVQGGRAYVSPQPLVSEMADIPFLSDMSTPNYCEQLTEMLLDRAIRHETKAVEIYMKLLNLSKGIDTALENWSMNQIQIETQDLTEFKEWAGRL